MLFPDKDNYHIVAFGVEEATSSEKKAQAELILEHLGIESWEIVGNAGKGQINICVFYKRIRFPKPSFVKEKVLAVDKLSYGLKGCAMVQFVLDDMKYSFISCHLASGAFKTEPRLKMAADILKRVDPDTIEPDALNDFNFFMGDMNMRFNRKFKDHEPDLADSPNLIEKYDQLYEVQQKGYFPGY